MAGKPALQTQPHQASLEATSTSTAPYISSQAARLSCGSAQTLPVEPVLVPQGLTVSNLRISSPRDALTGSQIELLQGRQLRNVLQGSVAQLLAPPSG